LRSEAVLWAAGAAVVGGSLAAVSHGRPTGLAPADGVLRVALVAGFALAATRARPWALIVAGGLAAAGAAGSAFAWPASAGLLLAVGSVVFGRGERLVGPAVGALVGPALLHLSLAGSPSGSSAAGAAVAALVVGMSGIRRLALPVRHALWHVGGTVMAIAVVFGLASAAAALWAEGPFRTGISQASVGLADGRRGNLSAAEHEFSGAARLFSKGRSRVNALWARPALALPVIGEQLRALRTLSRSGHEVARAAAAAARAGDAPELRPHDGGIDLRRLGVLAAALDRGLAAINAALRTGGEARSPWLLGPLEDKRRRFVHSLAGADGAAARAAETARLLPGLLGAEGERHYFLAITTPSELRGSGGFIGDYGVLTAKAGRVALTRFGRISELNGGWVNGRHLDGPPDYLAHYGRFHPERYFQDATFSPDFPSDARVIEQLYPQSGGERLDGVISVDPYTLAAVLGVTGALVVPPWPEPITAANAAQIMLHDAYVALPQEERLAFLDAVSQAVVRRLTSRSLPGPGELGRAFGPVLSTKRVLIQSTRSREEQVLADLGVAGALPSVQGDFLAVVAQDAVASKLDWYLGEKIDYRVRLDPASGRVRAALTVTLTNSAPHASREGSSSGYQEDRFPCDTFRAPFDQHQRCARRGGMDGKRGSSDLEGPAGRGHRSRG